MTASWFHQSQHSQKTPTLEETLTALVSRASDGQTPRIDPLCIKHILTFTNSVEKSAEVMSAIAKTIDHKSDKSIVVLKCVKLIYICLVSSDHFFKAARAYAPEIQTLSLLSFVSTKDPYRNLIHVTANQIYAYLLNTGNLPSPESLSLEEFKIPQKTSQARTNSTTQPQNGGQNIGQKTSSQKVLDDMISFSPAKEENDNKPRVPAAFAGGSNRDPSQYRNGAETQSLLSFDGDDQNDFNYDNSNEINLLGDDFSDINDHAGFAQIGNDDDLIKPISSTTNPNSNEGTFDPFASLNDGSQNNQKTSSANGLFNDFNLPSGSDHGNNDDNDENDLLGEFGGPSKSEEHVSNRSRDIFSAIESKEKELSENLLFGDENDSLEPVKGSGDGYNPFQNSSNRQKDQLMQPLSADNLDDDDNALFGSFEDENQTKQQSTLQSQNNVSADNDGETFDPFANYTQPKVNSANTMNANTVNNESGETFDPFANISQPSKQAPSSNNNMNNNDTFNPFSNISQSVKSNNEILPAPSSGNNNAVFDPFGDSNQVKPLNSGNAFAEPPKPQANSSANAFDLFDAPQQQAKPVASPVGSGNAFAQLSSDATINANTTDDTFDPFANLSQPSKPAASPAGSGNAFAAMGSGSMNGSVNQDDTFDPFSNITHPQTNASNNAQGSSGVFATPPKPQTNTSANAFDIFDAPSQTQASSPVAKESQFMTMGSGSGNAGNSKVSTNDDTFDPFSNFSQPKPQQQQQSPQQKVQQKPQLAQKHDSIQEEGETFDPFANISQGNKPQKMPASQVKASAPAGDAFDPFTDFSSKPAQPQHQQAPQDDIFDPFSVSSSQSQQQTQKAPIKPVAASNNDIFDPFESFAQAPQQQKQESQPQKSAPPPPAGDTFDPFAAFSQPKPEPQRQQQQSNRPQQQQRQTQKPPQRQQQPLTVSANSGGDTFDPFSDFSQKQTQPNPVQQQPVRQQQQQQRPQQQQQQQRPQQQRPQVQQQQNNGGDNLFDPFADFSQKQPNQQARKPPAPQASKQPSVDLYDPFGNNSLATPPPSTGLCDPFVSSQGSTGNSSLFDPFDSPAPSSTDNLQQMFELSKDLSTPGPRPAHSASGTFNNQRGQPQHKSTSQQAKKDDLLDFF